MVGTAVLRLSNCAATDLSPDDVNNSSDVANDTTTAIVCENEPADIAVTLALLVGFIMVSVYA